MNEIAPLCVVRVPRAVSARRIAVVVGPIFTRSQQNVTLFGVIAAAEVPELEIDVFVEQFRSTAAASTAALASTPQPEVIEIPSGRLRYLALGDVEAPPALLIHGFGGDLNSWLLNHSALANLHRVYAIDLPGQIRSATSHT